MAQKLVRVQISVDQDWKVTGRVWQQDLQNAPVVIDRQMQKCPDGSGGFFPAPVNPPPAADPTLASLLSGDAQEICRVYQSLLKRKTEYIQSFGQYLFESLVGKPNWDALVELPEVKDADLLEFALAWDSQDTNLHRLNWEMMAESGNFLAVHPRKKVAFTRIVEGTAQLQAKSIACPPKMLFVVGTDLDDPSIRPGAEFLALIRHMDGKTGCTLQSHLILKANIDLLVRTVDWYQPDVVYFICHGNIDNRGNFLYLMDKNQVNPEKVYADQLADAIRSNEKSPSIVILNACYSGQTISTGAPACSQQNSGPAGDETSGKVYSMGGSTGSPLAASLVKAGIPVVIAMAGRVSDNACRLFTRMCGEAIMEGESITVAAARGRRAAHLEGGSVTQSVDWALPTTFMSEAVYPEFRPVDPATIESANKIEARLKSMPLRMQPDNHVFCGREEFLSAYYSLFQAGGPRILCCQVNGDLHGYGKTRLLKEFSARAIREIRAPVLLLPVLNGQKNLEPPQTPGLLAYRILASSADTRKALGLFPPKNSQVLSLIQQSAPAALPGSLEFKNMAEFNNFLAKVKDSVAGKLSSGGAGDALREDLIQLSKEAQTDVLVLLDDVHLYDRALAALLQEWLTGFGMGANGAPVPVVMTFARNTPAEQYLRPFIEASNPRDVVVLDLGPFRSEGKDPLFSEDILAYERVFLNKLIRELPALAVNPNAVEGTVRKNVTRFRRHIKGIPINLASGEMEILGEVCQEEEFFIDFDDDLTIKRMNQLGLY